MALCLGNNCLCEVLKLIYKPHAWNSLSISSERGVKESLCVYTIHTYLMEANFCFAISLFDTHKNSNPSFCLILCIFIELLDNIIYQAYVYILIQWHNRSTVAEQLLNTECWCVCGLWRVPEWLVGVEGAIVIGGCVACGGCHSDWWVCGLWRVPQWPTKPRIPVYKLQLLSLWGIRDKILTHFMTSFQITHVSETWAKVLN